MLRGLIDDFGEAYGHLNIETSICEKAQARVRMNDTLASVLFSNLLKNAYLHNYQDGKVEIIVGADHIIVKNTAADGALNPDYIFRRFYQGHRKEGSAGLGLSLAESICRFYDMGLVYRYENEMHIFEIRFAVDKT